MSRFEEIYNIDNGYMVEERDFSEAEDAYFQIKKYVSKIENELFKFNISNCKYPIRAYRVEFKDKEGFEYDRVFGFYDDGDNKTIFCFIEIPEYITWTNEEEEESASKQLLELEKEDIDIINTLYKSIRENS